ncbi:MAG: hypothetical protein DI537_19195 [Stutzerimonas stutzeri]|nr:MAG: hypothetical protein DI537_19195 [Stutzerimonas stutzeri]
MILTHGSNDWYLPLWQDAHYLDANAIVGTNILSCSTASASFRAGDILMVGSHSTINFELVEVASVSSDGVMTADPLNASWSIDSHLHRVKRARLTEQPRPRRENDQTVSSQIRFRIIERNDEYAATIAEAFASSYRGFGVLGDAPDEAESLDHGYERIQEQIDNLTGVPFVYDSAAISFPNQRHSFTLHGRDEYGAFLRIIYALRGKAIPIWLPTFFNDFEMIADAANGATSLTVKHTGFTALGGPKTQRRDIMIEMADGTKLFRRILASSVVPDGEIIGLDSPFASGLKAGDVTRISFMNLARLDQDNIEISHKTDIAGVSTSVMTFRSTPDLRTAADGF